MSARQYQVLVHGEDVQAFLAMYDDEEIAVVRRFAETVNASPTRGAAPGVAIEIKGPGA